MCGIVGKVNSTLRNRSIPVRSGGWQTLYAIADPMMPESGQRPCRPGTSPPIDYRLSPNGHNPMCNEDGTVWIVFNGEIYNFQDPPSPSLRPPFQIPHRHRSHPPPLRRTRACVREPTARHVRLRDLGQPIANFIAGTRSPRRKAPAIFADFLRTAVRLGDQSPAKQRRNQPHPRSRQHSSVPSLAMHSKSPHRFPRNSEASSRLHPDMETGKAVHIQKYWTPTIPANRLRANELSAKVRSLVQEARNYG